MWKGMISLRKSLQRDTAWALTLLRAWWAKSYNSGEKHHGGAPKKYDNILVFILKNLLTMESMLTIAGWWLELWMLKRRQRSWTTSSNIAIWLPNISELMVSYINTFCILIIIVLSLWNELYYVCCSGECLNTVLDSLGIAKLRGLLIEIFWRPCLVVMRHLSRLSILVPGGKSIKNKKHKKRQKNYVELKKRGDRTCI